MKAIAGTQYGSPGIVQVQEIAKSTPKRSALARSRRYIEVQDHGR